MKVIEDRYLKAIEEIITINELKEWMNDLGNEDIENIKNLRKESVSCYMV